MSTQPTPPPDAIVIPGPSMTTEGIVRQTISQVRDAIVGLQGAADAVRSLGR